MDSESDGADWKQEERVLAVVAYRIEKVSQCLPKKFLVVNLITFGSFWVFCCPCFKTGQRNIGKNLMSEITITKKKIKLKIFFYLIFSFENGSDSFF
jgi:hypothetical protein